ncbi:MAG: hypothetical protein PVF70_10950 [Anaerolineales bacterium]
MSRDRLALPTLGIIVMLLSGCRTGTGDGPRSWIDMPLDRTRLDLAPIQILAHASSLQGVVSFSFTIDGEEIGEVSVQGGRFEAANVEWIPAEAGIYTLGVIATDSNGEAGEMATSILYVGDAGPNQSGFGDRMYGACDGVEGMHIRANPAMIPPGACSLILWEIGAPEDWTVMLDGNRVNLWGEELFCFEMTTALELSVETPQGDCRKYVIVDVSEDFELPPPVETEIEILFAAAPQEISRGQCAELYWEVHSPEPYEITLGEYLVDPVMSVEVCPEETTTYHLIVHRGEEPVERTQTVVVLGEGGVAEPTPGEPGPGPTAPPPAPDTTPPTISGESFSPSFVYVYGGTCTPTDFYISVNVSDAGGVASVVLDWTGYGVRDGPVTMNFIGGNQYVYALGAFMQSGWLDGFSITATDNASNTSSVTPSWNLDIEACGGGS